MCTMTGGRLYAFLFFVCIYIHTNTHIYIYIRYTLYRPHTIPVCSAYLHYTRHAHTPSMAGSLHEIGAGGGRGPFLLGGGSFIMP